MHLLFSDFFGNQDYEKRAKGPGPLSTEPRPLSAGTGSSLREGHGYDDCPHLFKREKKTRKKYPHEKMSTALSPYRKCNPFFDTTRITDPRGDGRAPPDVMAKPSQKKRAQLPQVTLRTGPRMTFPGGTEAEAYTEE